VRASAAAREAATALKRGTYVSGGRLSRGKTGLLIHRHSKSPRGTADKTSGISREGATAGLREAPSIRDVAGVAVHDHARWPSSARRPTRSRGV
jgi:hypothetical protein